MRTLKTQGIILKRKNIGEADKIITVMTAQEGKIQLIAKGIRRVTSRRSPHVELLNLSTLFLYKGKTFPILIEAQVIHDFADVKKDLRKIGFAYHLCELIDALCPEGAKNERAFKLLKNALSFLSITEDEDRFASEFEQSLLEILGFLPYQKKLTSNYLFIEQILERKLKSKRLISSFSS